MTPSPNADETGQKPLPFAQPMARRANWDKRRRMRLQIGELGDAKSVTVIWEGNSDEVDRVAHQFVSALNSRHLDQETIRKLREALDVAKDALKCAQSVGGCHELQDSEWDGARDCFKIALAGVCAVLAETK